MMVISKYLQSTCSYHVEICPVLLNVLLELFIHVLILHYTVQFAWNLFIYRIHTMSSITAWLPVCFILRLLSLPGCLSVSYSVCCRCLPFSPSTLTKNVLIISAAKRVTRSRATAAHEQLYASWLVHNSTLSAYSRSSEEIPSIPDGVSGYDCVGIWKVQVLA